MHWHVPNVLNLVLIFPNIVDVSIAITSSIVPFCICWISSSSFNISALSAFISIVCVSSSSDESPSLPAITVNIVYILVISCLILYIIKYRLMLYEFMFKKIYCIWQRNNYCILFNLYLWVYIWFITIVITCYLNILDENIWVVGLSELIIAIKFLKFSKWIEFSQDGNITK